VPAVSCPGHSTTSTGSANGKPLWDSGVHRASGFPYTAQFTTPGTYPYYCVVHGGPHPNNPVTHMDGVVIVDAAAVTAVSSGGTTSSGSTVATGQPAASGSGVSASSSSTGAGSLAASGPSGPMDRPWLPVVMAGLIGALAGLGALRRRVAG
jgi:hypothetical protein